MVGGWIASYVFIFILWSRCCCCCCCCLLLLLLPTTSVLKRFSAISPPLGLVSSRGLRAAIALSREGLARVRIRVKLRMTKGVVFFPYRIAIRSGLTCIILGAIRTYLQYSTIHHAWLVVFALWNRG